MDCQVVNHLFPRIEGDVQPPRSNLPRGDGEAPALLGTCSY